MSLRSSKNSGRFFVAGLLILMIAGATAWAQHGSEGKVSVTVVDPTGSVVQGAELTLVDLGTNEVRKGETQGSGIFSFVNLSLGTYRLTVAKTGFKTQVFDSVLVQATKTTDITTTLTVGALTETVVVSGGETPLVETSSSAIGSVIDLQQIENLPISGRNLTQMSQLVPGYTGTLNDGGGTWNGLPSIAQGSNIDGVVGSAGRMKFGGAAEPAVQPRIENIQEMTVQTDQLDLNQGFGNSTMQINFVTRRGTNTFHGRIFEDFRNAALNANTWFNDYTGEKKNALILNEFGGSLGGPVIKDRLFFFGTFAMSKQPGSINANVWVLTPAAQAGNFTYSGGTVNVVDLAGSHGLPTSNAPTADLFTKINNATSHGTLSSIGDPNMEQLNWLWPSPTTRYFPTVRVDYTPSEKMRFNLAWNMTKTNSPGVHPPNLPGPDFAYTAAGDRFKSYTAALGFAWTLSPTLVNEFRGGFLYNASFFAYNGMGTSSQKALTTSTQQIAWNLPGLPYPYWNSMNGTNFQIPTGSYYPVFNASDTLTWQHGAHTWQFGFSWWREQNHYYNGALGFPNVQMGLDNAQGGGPGGLATGDPAQSAINSSTVPGSSGNELGEAQALYSVLTGRLAGAGGSFPYDQKSNAYLQSVGAYNLDELQKAFGLYFQDSFRLKPNLTLNYGLRWDFTWPDYDLTNAYHSADPTALWGPSGIGNIFNPGVLNGTNDPLLTQNSAPAKPWYVAPQPAIGIAWNPRGGDGMFGRLLGDGKTVIRAGFSLRRFTEPQQYFWNQASDYGAVYYQQFKANANNSGASGAFSPGSLNWQGPTTELLTYLPNGYAVAPTQYQKSYSFSDFTFQTGPGINGVEANIRQPYTESWNFGIQRQLGESQALELRYVGNRSLRQWITINPNEVNVFENGFLDQFKAAQQNLAINNASGNANFQGSFANHNLPGQQALPVFDAAFAGEDLGPDGSFIDYTNGGFAFNLETGQAGSLANTLTGTGTVDYYCNLVPAGSFKPCANIGYSGPGGPYPLNFLQTNPFAANLGSVSQLVAKGYSNYNALQVDFRQRAWHGLQFDANYTWSHTLGLSTQNNWQGSTAAFTLRDMRMSYGPTLFDIRHSVHISGTYELPLGKGKTFANRGGVVDRIVGGWTLGSIFTLQTGNPFLLQGGYNTFNDYADGGVVLTGVTESQLQSSVGVYHIPGQPAVDFINPKYLANGGTGGGANPAFIAPNTTPGTIGQRVWLHGPRYVNDDLSISKRIAITERVRFSLQAEMLNAFNHPQFQPGSANGCTYGCFAAGFGFPNVQSNGFAIGGLSPSYTPSNVPPFGRQIELRANIEF